MPMQPRLRADTDSGPRRRCGTVGIGGLRLTSGTGLERRRGRAGNPENRVPLQPRVWSSVRRPAWNRGRGFGNFSVNAGGACTRLGGNSRTFVVADAVALRVVR